MHGHATAYFHGTTAARLAATATTVAATEQAALASATIVAAAARLSRTTTALFNDRAAAARLGSGTNRLLDDRTTTGWLGSTARLVPARCLAATAASLAALQEARIGLALHGDRRNHHSRQSQGSTNQNFPTHRNSSK